MRRPRIPGAFCPGRAAALAGGQGCGQPVRAVWSETRRGRSGGVLAGVLRVLGVRDALHELDGLADVPGGGSLGALDVAFSDGLEDRAVILIPGADGPVDDLLRVRPVGLLNV